METNYNNSPGTYSSYYFEQLEDSLEYQDFIMHELSKKGVHIQCFSSKRYQWDIGESNNGTEIKYDKKFTQSGNLYIETHEKSNPANYSYVPSGILRDNIMHWIQGDYGIAFMFSKKELAHYLFNTFHSLRYVENETKTSWGYLVPKRIADDLCIAKFRFRDRQLFEIVYPKPDINVTDLNRLINTPRKEKRLNLFGVIA